MSQPTISLTPEQLQTLKQEFSQLKHQIHDLTDRCVRIETLLEHFGQTNAQLEAQSEYGETSELEPMSELMSPSEKGVLVESSDPTELESPAPVSALATSESSALSHPFAAAHSANAKSKRALTPALEPSENNAEADEKVILSWAILYQGSLPPDGRPCYKGLGSAFFDENLPGPLMMWLCQTLQRAGYRMGARFYHALAVAWDKFNGTGPHFSEGVTAFDFLQFRETVLALGGPGFHAYALRHGLIPVWQIDEQGRISVNKLLSHGDWQSQCAVMCKYRWQDPELARKLFHEYRGSMDDEGVLQVLKTFRIRPSVLDETSVFELLHSNVPSIRETAVSVIRAIPHSAYSIACTRVIKLCLGYNVRLHKWLMPERAEMKGFTNLGIELPKTRSAQDQAWLRCEAMRGMAWSDLMQLTQTQEPREAILRFQDLALQTGLDMKYIETMLAERIAVAQDAISAKTLMQLRKTKVLSAYAKLLPLLKPWELDLGDVEFPQLLSNLFFSIDSHFDPLAFNPISKEWAQALLEWLELHIAQDDNLELDDNLAALMGLYLPLGSNLDGLTAAVDKLSKRRSNTAKERAQMLTERLQAIEKYLQVRQQLDSLQNAYLVGA